MLRQWFIGRFYKLSYFELVCIIYFKFEIRFYVLWFLYACVSACVCTRTKSIPPILTCESHQFQPWNFHMYTRILTCKLDWNCAQFGGLKNFTPENVRPEMYIPKTGLKIFTPTQAWKLSHLKQVWTFSWKIEKWIYLLRHVPSQTIYTWRPSFAIPHIFYTGNKSS